jgi:hypothetical protein
MHLTATTRWAKCTGWAFALLLPLLAPAQQPPPPKAPPWTKFVRADGHANQIPIQWLDTPEGRFAHSIKIPNPVPADTGYRGPKDAKAYWKHLCATEAGNFVFKTVDKVDGLLFLRHPGHPTDDDHRDQWKLEAPGLQGSWQLKMRGLGEWAAWFVNPPWATYAFIEQPRPEGGYWRFFGYVQDKAPMQHTSIDQPLSRYALTWRGLRRPNDRELGISGAEWIILDRTNGEVLAVLRDYYLTGFAMANYRPQGLQWLNAFRCPFKRKVFAHLGDDAEWAVWTPRVLQPHPYPEILKFVDEQTGGKR